MLLRLPRRFGWLLGRGRFRGRLPGNVSGAMFAEYQMPEAVPDVPAMPGPSQLPADPTDPGGDPEPMAIAA
ncbi:MAG: hypothetical protein NVS3B7_07710 [Candidatus Elarobacter sp.]